MGIEVEEELFAILIRAYITRANGLGINDFSGLE